MFEEFRVEERPSLSSTTNLVRTSKERTRDLFKRRLIYTDLHGIHKVFDKRVCFLRRMAFGVAIILLLGLLIPLWIGVVKKLFYPPIKTSRSLIALSNGESQTFPAITICYYAQYSLEFIRNYGELRGFVAESWPDIRSIESTVDEQINSFNIHKNFSDPENILSAASDFPGDHFVECQFNSNRYACGKFLKRVLTNFGFCVHYFGANYGASGLRVTIHRPGTEPDVSNYGFWISPGSDTQVALTATTTLLVERNGCKNDLPTLEENKSYTMNSCIMNCVQSCITQKCSCKLIFMPGNVSVCNSIEAKVSKVNATLKEIKDGAIKTSIFFKTTKTLSLQQYSDYNWLDMLCELGGQLGLFVGASILTVVQIIEVIFSVIFYFIKTRGKKISPKK
ncbi:DgyrCDS12487 [Dimorphilus gyrociliatus]|uniref:DgyrCDS12487 n=1 Tax=Dimorphilus gyrociliatus TaxID=2664684 RepID=A0A7I8W816_9ANNE|nr:DgyrCDS12487 [Dimorphilus gyrociliatus]